MINNHKLILLVHLVKRYLIQFGLLFTLSLLSVNYLSPEYLNADVLLNSIMSLQNITLFYWGQNRLINFIPLFLSSISNPILNISLFLIFSAFVFYAMVWKISYYIAMLKNNIIKYTFSSQIIIFLIFILIFIFLYTKYTLFNFIIWHIEYIFSYLLFLYIIDIFIHKEVYTKSSYFIITILSFISIGINNSILLVILAFFVFYIFIKQNKITYSIIHIFIALISFFIWIYIASKYGDTSAYSGLNLHDITRHTNQTIFNILATISTFSLLILLFIISGFKFIFSNTKEGLQVSRVILAIFIFMVSWFLLFSNHKWIELNQYHFRYFFPIFIGIVFIFTIYIWSMVTIFLTNNKFKIVTILILFSIIILKQESSFIQYKDYNTFKSWSQVDEKHKQNIRVFFHAGDYWQVWSAVMYDMMDKKSSYGLAFRSEGNKDKILSEIKNEMKSNNKIVVYCHNSTIEECSNQVFSKFKNAKLKSNVKIKEGIEQLMFIPLL